MGVEIRQLALDLAQQHVIPLPVQRIGWQRLAEPDEKILEIVDMIVDAGRKRAGFIDGLLNRSRLVALPLAPETGPDEGGEWNHGGNHQGQKTRSNAPQHPHSPADWNLLPTPRLSPKNRLLPSHRQSPDATAIAPTGQVRCRSAGAPQLLRETPFR
jgi:hypothetical protein